MTNNRFSRRVVMTAVTLALCGIYASQHVNAQSLDEAKMQRCADLGNIGAAAMTMRHDNVPVIDAIGRYPGDQLAQDLVMAAYDERFVIVADMVRDDNIARFRNRVQMDCLKGRL